MSQGWDFIDNYIKHGYSIFILFINKDLDLKSQAKLMLCEQLDRYSPYKIICELLRTKEVRYYRVQENICPS